MSHDDLLKILQIIFADIILSGDNALVIGMAAAGVSDKLRRRAIFIGMAVAAILRILFATIASYLLLIPGILFFGGILLVWVCWRFYVDLRSYHVKKLEMEMLQPVDQINTHKQFRKAMITILIADVSMSIDNVVAVAAIARENTVLLILGLLLAIAMMALCATLLMKILTRFPVLSYAGLIFLVYLAATMLYDGSFDVAELLVEMKIHI